MATMKKVVAKEVSQIEGIWEKVKEALSSVPGIIWFGIVNVVISYGYLFLPEGAIINRSLNSVNLEVVFIYMLVATLAGIVWSIFSKKAGNWCRIFSILLNVAAAFPWYALLYFLIRLVTFQ